MLRILCLEDDEIDFEIINMTLQKSGLETVTKMVDSRDKFLSDLITFQPDVILSDHSLPQFNSIEALSLSHSKQLNVPFILVTGAVSDEFAVDCIKRGADDYVLKSNLSRLPSAIKKALKHKETEKAKMKAMSALAERNDELVKINRELDSLVYSVSHNLRAPLMSVLGLVNLAKLEHDAEAIHRYHEMMESSIYKLDDTLKEILDYARNARQDPKVEPVNFRQLIDDTLKKMQFMDGFKEIDVRVSVEERAVLHTDSYRLALVMNNLISNAIKYFDRAKPDPFFEISVVIDEDHATLIFRDNGIGIDASFLPKIFDMFFRATTKVDGSGLGLYIVKEAVSKLGGAINIESKLAVGTTFYVSIPDRQHAPQEGVA